MDEQPCAYCGCLFPLTNHEALMGNLYAVVQQRDRLKAALTVTNQGGTMAEMTLPRDFDTRLAALDRAINRLHGNPEASPDEVVALAEKFERYLTRADG